ncbi:MAG: sensor histidine kinase [Mycobacteriaceae bacterium]|nr:sensor histidine kinase [Mycobacteriaceae bacterium]
MELPELDRIRHAYELNALRIVALVRLGVAVVMIVAAHVGLRPKWPAYAPIPWGYLLVAISAAAVLFSSRARTLDSSRTLSRLQLVLVVIDVAMVVTFKLSCPDGAYVPLLALTLLPLMVVLDVSWRRAALVLAAIAVFFAFEISTDPVMREQIGQGRMILVCVVFVFLCCTVWLAVYAQARHIDEIARLTASRQELLIDAIGASDEQRRVISEYIHDGPLQSVLMARQDIVAVLKRHPDEGLDRALAGLRDATAQMREATFELHPAVLAGAGLARALTQLSATQSDRSGIDITVDIDYPRPDETDPLVFGVARELLSNVVRHSRATRAKLTLKESDGVCRLDVVDDGIGVCTDEAARRLAEGHIGLASQRIRVEAAGGSMYFMDVPTGTHVAVTVPLVDSARPVAALA